MLFIANRAGAAFTTSYAVTPVAGSTDGAIAEFPVPTPRSQPNTIRPGPDTNPAEDCAYQRDALALLRSRQGA